MDEPAIIDSAYSDAEATLQNPNSICPVAILQRQVVVPVQYWSFDKKLHQGQLVIDGRLKGDILAVFTALLEERFPLQSVIPIADALFRWDDISSMSANNSSGFNYRKISGTDRLSLHALGQAIDLNPLLNPFIRGDDVQPPGAVYDQAKPGTITADSSIIGLFDTLGWEWGGRWKDRQDYQHFQKKLD